MPIHQSLASMFLLSAVLGGCAQLGGDPAGDDSLPTEQVSALSAALFAANFEGIDQPQVVVQPSLKPVLQPCEAARTYASSGPADDVFLLTPGSMSIQQAVDSLPDGGVIWLSAGTWVLEQSVIITDGISIFGEGPDTIIQLADAVDPDTLQGLLSVRGDDVEICQLHIDGNRFHNPTVQQWGKQAGISIWQADNTKVYQVSIQDVPLQGVFTWKATGGLIDSVTVDGTGHAGKGIHVYLSSDYSVRRCVTTVPTPGYDGIYLDQSTDSKISRCEAYDAQYDGLGIYGPDATGNEISNSVAINCGGGGIFMNSPHNVLVGNTLKNNQIGIWLSNTDIGAHHNLIVDNLSRGNDRFALAFNSALDDYNVVLNNDFRFNRDCYFDSADHNSFAGNQCESQLIPVLQSTD